MFSDVSWEGLWTLSFGLSQFHGHGSWLVCEVALNDIKVNWFLFHRTHNNGVSSDIDGLGADLIEG